jgi:hypothetical protein
MVIILKTNKVNLIIVKTNKVNLFVSSALFVFWYHSPSFLDTPRMSGMVTYNLRQVFMCTMVVKTQAVSLELQQVTLMLQISPVDLQQYKQQYMLQQQQKRLLQAQQQQQLVIPPSATTVVEQLQPGLQSIDSLLNNTVAPNVSLQVLKLLEMIYFIFNYALYYRYCTTHRHEMVQMLCHWMLASVHECCS